MSRELAAFALRLAWQQLRRRARRSLGAFLGIAGALVLVLTQLGFEGGLQDSAVRIHQRMEGEVVLASSRFRALRDIDWLDRGALTAALGHPTVRAAAPLSLGQIQLRNPASGSIATVMGIGLDLDRPALASGLSPGTLALLRLPGRATYDRRGQPVLGEILPQLAASGLAEVQTAFAAATLQDQLSLIGSHALGGTIAFESTLLMSEASFAAITGRSPERITLGVLRLRAGADPAQVAAELGPLLPPGVVALTRAALIRQEQDFWATTTPIGFVFSFGVAVGFAICGLSIWQALGQVLDENMAEYAVLKTMGYPRGFFLLLVSCTALLLALAAVPLAGGIGLGLYRVIAAATGLEMVLPASRIALVAAAAAGTGLLTALLARRRIDRADPAALMG